MKKGYENVYSVCILFSMQFQTIKEVIRIADYTIYGLHELRKLSKANFLKIRELEKTNETIDVSLELFLAREQDVAICDALAIKQEEADRGKK